MINSFTQLEVPKAHNKRDYFIAAFTFFCVAFALITDASGSLDVQRALALCAWIFLCGLLQGETPLVRVQVIIAILFATLGEYFASPFMGGYTYRFHNVPAYVPPGHGMVYLTAVALARSRFFLLHAKYIALFVVLTCGLWSIWGVSGIPIQGDAVGALLYCVLLIYLFKGRSPMVYLAAFFITTWLELIGTSAGTWHWNPIDPVLNLPQGNPPSGVSAWYCLVDAVAIGGSVPAMKLMTAFQERYNLIKTGKEAFQSVSED
jgi:hypothetical protein